MPESGESLRHVHLEPAATAVQSVHDLHGATHARRCLLDNGKPKAGPSGVGVLPAVEAIEDARTIIGLNAGPVIGYGQDDDVTWRTDDRQLDHNAPAVIAIADCIVNQVLQNGLHGVHIHAPEQTLRSLQGDLHVAGQRRRDEITDLLTRQLGHIRRRSRRRGVRHFQAGQNQKLVNQVRGTGNRRVHGLPRFRAFLLALGFSQHVCLCADHGQGSAQLVRRIGDENPLLQTSSRGAFALTAQARMDKVIERLKKEAASLGANGILIQAVGEQSSGTSVITGVPSRGDIRERE